MPVIHGHAGPGKLHSFQIAQGQRGTEPPRTETGAEGAHSEQGAKHEHNAGEVPPADLLFANAVFVAVIMIALGVGFTRRLHEVPKGFANLGEWLAESMRN